MTVVISYSGRGQRGRSFFAESMIGLAIAGDPALIDAVTAVSYRAYMSDMTATVARERFSEALATSSREPVFITRHGKRVAVLVTAEFYDRAIEAIENAEDIAAARAALAEDEPSIPWEVVKADLGLV